VARDKTVPEAARETVSAAPEFRRGHGITVAATPQRGAMLTQYWRGCQIACSVRVITLLARFRLAL
jgi:hypothetical protein